jgi:predicted CXXCH cytochrome family protein
MIIRPRWTRNTLIFGGATLWGLLLISCVVANRTMLVPPFVAGAEFVGTKKCAECHADKTDNFASASHNRLALSISGVGNTGCESCHGQGSLHSESGGARGTIINPRRSPETCFQCHTDKRGQFNLPNSHPVLAGQVSCADCHDVHAGDAIRDTGTAFFNTNATCTKCHVAQKGPFLFEHGAMKEGCTSCHNPHGTINQRMLVARDANLCLRCHLERPEPDTSSQINANAIRHTAENHNTRLMQGTCWSAGCHEAPHGSNANNHFRR